MTDNIERLPLFWGLSTDSKRQAASQAALMEAYHALTGEKLEPPPVPPGEIGKPKPVIDMRLEEIDKFMRQAPRRQKRVT